MASRKPDIICFGDSLTVGYQAPTPDVPVYRETPYGEFLQKRVGPHRHVAISGICGETTKEMVTRFSRDVLQPSPHYVVILGGTNDLGWDLATADILNNLILMYTQAQATGIQPIAVTIPSLRLPGDDDSESSSPTPSGETPESRAIRSHIERRVELNGLLLDHCSSHGIPCADFFSETAEQDRRQLAAEFSNDGLHLSTRGYEALAQLLWDQVFEARFGSERERQP